MLASGRIYLTFPLSRLQPENTPWLTRLLETTEKEFKISGAALYFRVIIGMMVGELETLYAHCGTIPSNTALPLLSGASDAVDEEG